MKKIIFSLTGIIIFYFFVQTDFAQIPNSGFENWTGGNPDSWTTNNIIGFLELVTQSNDAHSGNSSAKMEMMTAMSSLMQPVLNAGPITVGIPVTTRHGTINFYYKYAPTTSTVYLVAVVGMYKSGTYIGGGIASTKSSTSSYTKLTSTISYINQNVPDMATIYITLLDSFFNSQSAGTIALIDDIYFDQPNDITDSKNSPDDYSLSQNYPNPFNPNTVIRYQLPVSGEVTLKVYDILGNEIATLVDDYKTAGKYEVEFTAISHSGEVRNLPSGVSAIGGYASGVYFYQLLVSALQSKDGKSDSFVETKKMVLMK
jgi:hypothetical protein